MSDLENSHKAGKGIQPLKLLGLAAMAGAGGWIVYSNTMIDHNMPLPLAIDSDRRMFSSLSAGLLNYYVDESGQGRPLVLIHSINAAASAYEMRPIFEHYRGRRPVYALDLPGYGFSERSDRYYTPELFAGAIRDFLDDVLDQSADLIALSLGSEFAARVAVERPDLVNSLATISPTGLSTGAQKASPQTSAERAASQQGTNRAGNDDLLNLFRFPLWSQALFDLLATRKSINYYLNKSFHGAPAQGLVDYAYLSSHQPGARHAPLHFISGKLFTPHVLRAVYAKLQQPGLMIYDKDPYTSFEAIPDLLLAQPNWSAVRVTPTRGLPQFEEMATLARVLDNFWQGLGS